MQQPRPATTSLIRSRRPARSLTSFDLDVRGEAPLPAFLTPYRRCAGDPDAFCLSLGAGRRESGKRSAKPEDSYFSSHSGLKDSKRSPCFDRTRVKFPSPPNFIRYFTIHFTRSHKATIRELNAVRIAEKMELHVAQTPDAAGATPPFAARCVTGLVGSLPPHQFSEGTTRLLNSVGPSAVFTTRLDAAMVNGKGKTPFTVTFTDPFTLGAMRSHRDFRSCAQRSDEFGRRENTGLGWSDPS